MTRLPTVTLEREPQGYAGRDVGLPSTKTAAAAERCRGESTIGGPDVLPSVPAAVTLRTAPSRYPVCPECGADLSDRRRGIKRCSVRCRVAAHRARRAEEQLP